MNNTLLNNLWVKEEVSREIESTSLSSWDWMWCKGSWHSPPVKWQQEPGPQAPQSRTDVRMRFKHGGVGVGWALRWENGAWRTFETPVVLFSDLLPLSILL